MLEQRTRTTNSKYELEHMLEQRTRCDDALAALHGSSFMKQHTVLWQRERRG